MDPLITLLASLAVGLAVGVLSGLLGIGGGTILVPLFKLGYALEPIVSTATSLVTIIPTSISGAIGHIRRKTCVPALGVAAGLGGALTSPVGVWLATVSPDWAIMVAAAAVIAYSAITMFKKAIKAPKEGKATAAGASAAGADAPSAAVPSVPRMTRRQLALGVGVGAIAGVASGYVGLGGGFVIVPLMVSLFRIPMKLTSGTSLIAVALLAAPAAVTQALYGNVEWMVAAAVAVGSVPGALWGARLIPHVPERALRFIFSGFLLVGAVMLVLNQAGVL